MFSTKNIDKISDINILNFNKTLTYDVVSFEQPGPVIEANIAAVRVVVEPDSRFPAKGIVGTGWLIKCFLSAII